MTLRCGLEGIAAAVSAWRTASETVCSTTFRSAVTEERLLPFTALSDRCVLRRLCRLACV